MDETIFFLGYIAGAFVTFGAVLKSMGAGAAIFLAPVWPAYWLAHLGYWFMP